MEQLKNKRNKTVLVGMSGGVDSTVTAYILKNKGYNVLGITMSIWDGSVDMPELGKSGCYGPGEEKDIKEAKELATKLGIKHLVVDLKEEYKASVIDYFRKEYKSGRTPNPCVICNQRIKFGFMIEKAKQLGIDFDYFATGHYVRVVLNKKSGRYLLKKGLDRSKDQSYFLAYLKQNQLSKVIFPLGDKTKEEIKNIARDLGFIEIADKKESQDFIEADSHSVLFEDKDIKPGDIVDPSGKKLGKHKGIILYTIGQRKGLDINAKTSNSKPLYVTRIDSKTNRIIVDQEDKLLSTKCTVKSLNWIAFDKLNEKLKVSAKIRQQHKEEAAIISKNEDTVTVEFERPQRAITPGQIIVFYDKDTVLGGGVIEKGHYNN